jgi:hypothetical protein
MRSEATCGDRMKPAAGPRTLLARANWWLGRAAPFLLVVFAAVYYAQYYRSGLNLSGEGGTAAVIAMRLNEGWLPIKETDMGYNVLWFWPIAWLFELTGPNYIALRVYFFALCTLTALLGYCVVRRVTGLAWLAAGVGVLLVLIPGMQFRNYMGLLPVLNMLMLLQAFVLEPKSTGARVGWMALAGAALSLTFLVRVDVGAFFLVIFAGLVVLYPLGVRTEFIRRLPVAIGGLTAAASVFLLVHTPFYLDAKRRGYGSNFVGQYINIPSLLWYEASKEILKTSSNQTHDPRAAAGRRSANPAGQEPYGFIAVRSTPLSKWRQEQEAARKRAEEEARRVLQREPLDQLWQAGSFYQAAFIIILHLPVAIAGVIILVGSGALLVALVMRNGRLKESALIALVSVGSALTIFSQYYFFRPDTPHLSEFMCPFLVAMTCSSWLAVRSARRWRHPAISVPCYAFVALCVTDEGLFVYHSFPKESAGTIAAAWKRPVEYVGENGVRVWVKKREGPRLQAMHEAIVRHSSAEDWVVCFPYSPTINFMTNRRSYVRNLYVDNATAPARFNEHTIAEIRSNRPAVIVIDDRAINQNEQSRFSRWAAETFDYIRRTYRKVGVFDDTIEVYVRPDKVRPSA